MSTLEQAIALADIAHAGQLDKAGQPCILHPLRLMLAVQTLHERMTAALHDVVEDTRITLDDLSREGFPESVLTAVEVPTKRPGETRIEAAQRAVGHPIARVVKLADVNDNMDFGRITTPTEKDYVRMREYEQVRRILLVESTGK